MQVKLSHNLPTLPRYRDLALELAPIHSKLSREGSFAKKHPVYRCNEVQVFTFILACLLLLLMRLRIFHLETSLLSWRDLVHIASVSTKSIAKC